MHKMKTKTLMLSLHEDIGIEETLSKTWQTYTQNRCQIFI